MKKTIRVIASVILALIMFGACQDGSIRNYSGARLNNLNLQTSAVGDFVWDDTNMNGIQDDGETGLAGVTVNLYGCDDNLLASDTTGENGSYLFNELEPGEYVLGFIAPDGYVFSPRDQGDNDLADSDPNPETGKTDCFALESDTQDLSRDAGLYAAGDDGCTYGKGFWKNHAGMGPQDDLVTDLLPLRLGGEDGENGLLVETAEVAYNILQQQTYGEPSNGITRLYAHFLAAKLNIANGASDADIVEAAAAADAFLATHDWNDWDNLSGEEKQMINDWKSTFEMYNEGEIGPGHCDEEDLGF